MRSIITLCLALPLIGTGSPVLAQAPDSAVSLVGSWVLVALEDAADGARAGGARGLLVLDGAGNVFEYFSRPEPGGSEESGARRTLATVGGFWGEYSVDEDGRSIRFASAAGVSPDLRGLSFTREYALDGDRLVVTTGREPQAQDRRRLTWQRMPTVENLSPAYREVVGFWQHVVERQVVTESGEVERSSERAPSVIVYTPAGFVGVHFPPLGREPLGTDMPDADAALAAMRGYIGYFGTLGVYPGEVTHNLLSGVSPGTGSILRRYAEIDGDELVVRLQSAGFGPPGEGPRVVTEVVLRRLSGAEDMLPR